MTQRRALTATDERSLADTLSGIIASPGVEVLVGIYLTGPPSETIAGTLFDSLGPAATGEFTVADIAAVSLLDVRFGPVAVHHLIYGEHLQVQLAAIKPDVDLWDERAPLLELRAIYDSLRQLPGVGPTKASKLLARKLPRLAPITDSVVDEVLDSDGWMHLETLAVVLRANGGIRHRLEELARGCVTPLRALDIAIWMLGSGSKAARLARVKAAGTVPGMSKPRSTDRTLGADVGVSVVGSA